MTLGAAMDNVYIQVLFAVGLFLVILFLIEAGRFLRARHRTDNVESARAGHVVVEGAIFGLMGLMLAFTFSWSFMRFDTRRHLIVEEANYIRTAYLRLSLLPTQAQSELQEKFRQYVDARVAAYRAFPDSAKVEAGINQATAIQGEIWPMAVAASQQMASPQASLLILPSLNLAFDTANTRYMSIKMHRPMTINCLMAVLVLTCSLLAGFSMGDSKARSWIHAIIFAALLTITVYTIIDLEYPRIGLIQVSYVDQALIDVRNAM
jgi:hypothetical protein